MMQNSMILTIIVVMSVFTLTYGLTCGGNCPSNTCTSCICGSTKHIYKPADYCKAYAWSQSCCVCIATRTSAGNRCFMAESRGGLEIGLLGIYDDDAQQCNMQPSTLCDLKSNMKCGYEQYIDYGKDWSYWGPDADACGCDTGTKSESELTQKQRRHLAQIYSSSGLADSNLRSKEKQLQFD